MRSWCARRARALNPRTSWPRSAASSRATSSPSASSSCRRCRATPWARSRRTSCGRSWARAAIPPPWAWRATAKAQPPTGPVGGPRRNIGEAPADVASRLPTACRHSARVQQMKTTRVVAIAALCFLPILVIAEDRPYSLGPVTSVSYIRVKPGQYDNYMRYLAGPYRKQLEANVKAGLVVSWKVFDASPRNDKEPNVILTTTYPNMATLDKQKE